VARSSVGTKYKTMTLATGMTTITTPKA